MYDLVIRGGTIVDGTGRPRFEGDVAIDGETIVAVGGAVGPGRREIDAAGLIVTPGFVDIHTHYDGQATWDSELAPSSWHGVTSIVMGNCGVGFAPAAPDRHDFLIRLMEGVEDIPGTALAEGLSWEWESLPQYFDAVDRRPHSMDIGAQVPHSALRAYVMGERGADHEADPTDDEIEAMARLTKEALLAGALGFATSRTRNHRTKDGQLIGSLSASYRELSGIASALRETGRGVIECAAELFGTQEDLMLLRQLAEECGRPISMLLLQEPRSPGEWRDTLNFVEAAGADGVPLKAQVCGRPIGLLMGLEATMHPFSHTATYEGIAELPLVERVARMRQPEVKARILAEHANLEGRGGFVRMIATHLDRLFDLGTPLDYEPPVENTYAARAARDGTSMNELIYDALLQDEGHHLLFFALTNYAENTLDPVREMLTSEHTVFGLSDGGAHVGMICDASTPTSNLTLWARDRTRGERLPLEFVVQRQTSATARHVGWDDRGVIAPGYLADVNVVDFANLRLEKPFVRHDLPAGGRRLLQRADGYRFTIKRGAITYENGEFTGALPGRLVRGAQAAP